MQLSIDGEGHLSYVELTDEQVKFLRELLDEDLATLATAARWAIEQSRLRAIEQSRLIWGDEGEQNDHSS